MAATTRRTIWPLHAGRYRVIAAFSAAVVLLVAWLATPDPWVALVVSGCVVTSMIKLIRLFLFARLTIDSEGIAIINLWRRHTIPWHDVNTFVIDSNEIMMVGTPYSYACIAVKLRTGEVIPADGLRASSASDSRWLKSRLRQLNEQRKLMRANS